MAAVRGQIRVPDRSVSQIQRPAKLLHFPQQAVVLKAVHLNVVKNAGRRNSGRR
jgi:hypothetical protein